MASLENDVLVSETRFKRPTSAIVSTILTFLTAGIAVSLTVVSIPFLTPALRRICLPYVPATSKQVENVMKALQGSSTSGKLVDLGSGDGRIVIAAAKKGFMSHGVEMNIWLVLYSRIAAFQSGVGSLTAFYRRDLWKTSLVPYNTVIIFGISEMMTELEEKVKKEMKPGAKVIACRFPIPNKACSAVIGKGIDQVWIYNY